MLADDPQVLLVGWDAADWKIISPLLDAGLLPHLEALINRGVMGDVRTLRPVLSPMLWNSIATGHRPERHGVHGFTEVDSATNTIRSVSSTTRACKALWNIVTQAGGRAHVVNWYASHPAEPIHGISVSDYVARGFDGGALPPGAVHPAELADEFSDLRLGPDEIDEGTLKLFVPRLAEVDQDRDPSLVQLARLLSESFTVHNLATRVLSDAPWNLAAVYYPGIDHFCHGFINYHPPRPAWVSEERFALYSEVIRGAYRLHDLFLGRLLQLVGPNTSVVLVSDHGFHSDHLRPRSIPSDPLGPAVQHRDHGVLVMAGPALRHDERIYGATLLDVAPTVLTLLGLPVGQDMPGKVLTDAFETPPPIASVPSWEDQLGEDGRHPPGFVAPSHDQSLLLEQFAALGYVDLDEMQGSLGPQACRRENTWNHARSLLDGGQPQRAVELLVELCAAWPERGEFGLALAEGLRRLGLTTPARQVVEALVARMPASPPARYLLGMAAVEDGRWDEAVQQLQAVSPAYADRADLHVGLGSAYLRLGKVDEAQQAFQRATALDPHEATAWVGLARCASRKRQWELTERHALHALGLDFQRPLAHALLGAARLRLGRTEEADLALRMAAKLAPRWLYPRRLRAWLWQRRGGDQAMLAEQEMAAARAQQPQLRVQAKFASAEQQAAIDRVIAQYRGGRINAAASAPDVDGAAIDLVIVSGLPRSGTSLVMQMLAAGGLPILTDGERAADVDNPAGYLEWEPIRRLPRQPELMRQAAGKAVKVVSPLLAHLPAGHKYRVLFVDRPIDEVLKSQQTMRTRRGQPPMPAPARMRAALESHRDASLAYLRRTGNMQVLTLAYHQLLENPEAGVAAIAKFLGDRLPHPERMAQAIRPDLYRHRGGEAPSLSEPLIPS